MLNAISNVLDILVPVVGITYICLNCYNKTKVELVTYVSELIAMAERTGLTGPEKMAQVVAKLYEKVPKWLKKHLNEKQLEMIAQWIFDWMRRYADAYVEASKADESIEDKVDKQTDIVIAEATTELFIELLDMTEDALREKAVAYGIELNGTETKEEVVKTLILSVLKVA